MKYIKYVKFIMALLLSAILVFLSSCSSVNPKSSTTDVEESTGLIELTELNQTRAIDNYVSSDFYGDLLLIGINEYVENDDSAKIGLFLYDAKTIELTSSTEFPEDYFINALDHLEFDSDGNIVIYGWKYDDDTEIKAVYNQDFELLSSEEYDSTQGSEIEYNNPLISDRFAHYDAFAKYDDRMFDSSHFSVLGFYNDDSLYFVNDYLQNYLDSDGNKVLCTLNDDENATVAVYDYDNFCMINKATCPPIIDNESLNATFGTLSDKYAFVLMGCDTQNEEEYITKGYIWNYNNGAVNTPFKHEKVDKQDIKDKTNELIADIKEKFDVDVTIDKKGGEDHAPVDSSGESGLEYGADELTSYYMVKNLEIFMSMLPENFTKEMIVDYMYDDSADDCLEINIIKNIKGEAAAYAYGSSMVFATDEFSVSQIPHEFMHVIDNRIYYYYTNKEDAPYDGNYDEMWCALNPKDFNYDQDEYNEDYFVSYYAMTNWVEDRAETFMFLCDGTYNMDWYKDNEALRKKADFLIKSIHDAFPSVQKETDKLLWESNLPE